MPFLTSEVHVSTIQVISNASANHVFVISGKPEVHPFIAINNTKRKENKHKLSITPHEEFFYYDKI